MYTVIHKATFLNTLIEHTLTAPPKYRPVTVTSVPSYTVDVLFVCVCVCTVYPVKKSILTSDQYRRARHVITENNRVIVSIQSIQVKDYKKFGQLMKQSHTSLKYVSSDILLIAVIILLECEISYSPSGMIIKCLVPSWTRL